MKVIFLDFDGVLNSDKYLRTHGGFGVIIDPNGMLLLKEIVSATGAKIVLSTSWREHWGKLPEECDDTGVMICDIFRSFGLELHDKTPQLHTGRPSEIKAWLAENPEVTNFVALDDMRLVADFLEGHFIKTSGYRGLNENDAKEAIKILNC